MIGYNHISLFSHAIDASYHEGDCLIDESYLYDYLNFHNNGVKIGKNNQSKELNENENMVSNEEVRRLSTDYTEEVEKLKFTEELRINWKESLLSHKQKIFNHFNKRE